ncbi:MAG: DEAD/DEAH box helicase family protein [Candidatus Dadabacteria bacterium]|nr:DEAD/DEAH box helicase family protein [Candidatus Dadabacteria bacterium]MDE0476831.1 DEAD/DEAH box helicase family protein [Candidatus Dadabacteria bacterium]
MKSENFEFLRERWPELASLGGFAEFYTYTDPTSALVKLRLLAENLTRDIYNELRFPRPPRSNFVNLLEEDTFCTFIPKVLLNKLHALRIHGNKAAHGETTEPRTVLRLLKEAHDLALWLAVNFEEADPGTLPSFNPPSPDPSMSAAEKAKLEKLASQEAQLNDLLLELDQVRERAETAEKKSEELEDLAASAKTSTDLLEFDEATTRSRIIDGLLASAGWDVGPDLQTTDSVAKEYEVADQPTTTGKGFIDYVLWDDDGAPLAVIEAKKTSVEPELGRKQAKLYADALEKAHGQRPVIFYTNGYDIWLWDDMAGYPPRRIHGYYSKDSLQYLVKFQRGNQEDISVMSPRETIVDRLYQIETIKRVAERFLSKHRKALIVHATGTGKTRVAIALSELLIRAGWAKRVLYLCDRRELRRQAKNAFTDFLPSEPIRIVNSRIPGVPNERIFIATYPAMLKVYQSFDVGFFDLIIADESHRSIYNVYGDLFHYFDALQVGLTATPVDFVTRSTFNLFDCQSQMPTSNYDLERAVEEGYLVPFEVFEHTTRFLREGIHLDGLTQEQIAELEEQGEDPSQYDFGSEQIDKDIYNKDTNRAILRNLMENGLREATAQVVGKTIIFARNHRHAVLMNRLFDEMYPQYGGQFCQVIDNYDPRAEQLIDDFKGEGDNQNLTVAISVDMLDTGIDVPEILNLVFAKPVRSPVKFWQMIGRGTRLCPNLLGPGEDKTVFRIFDHWGNFERFETGYKPAEPRQSKSLLQLLFEERLNLAEAALRKSEEDVFDQAIRLVEADIADLPEESVSVRECWRERHSVLQADRLRQFAPVTVSMLRTVIAPLMQWRAKRGLGDAHAFDLLVTQMQTAVLNETAALADLKVDFLERVEHLQMHLNPVRERGEIIRRVKSEDFWKDVSVQDLESVRGSLREIIHYHDKQTGATVSPKIIDVSEESEGIVISRRRTNLRTVEMEAYKHLVEDELKKHFETNPVLKKIRTGETVTKEDLESLVSLVLTQNPHITRKDLNEFFQATAQPLYVTIRSIVGLDPGAVKAKFSDLVLKNPLLTAKQTRFLTLLQNHIIKFGFITVEKLYDQPFTVVDADGPEGVFDRPEDIDDLIKIVNLFAPPQEGGDDADQENRIIY